MLGHLPGGIFWPVITRQKFLRGLEPMVLGVLVTLLSCNDSQPPIKYPPPSIGFYHWQQRPQLDSLPAALLATEVPLHTRFFDLVWTEGQVDAVSIVSFDRTSTAKQLLPVIFITNEVMKFSSEAQRERLAREVIQLVDTLYLDYLRVNPMLSLGSRADPNQPLPYPALQIDCDWTISSRDNYFAFLRRLRALLPAEKELSVTVRLHQYRHTDSQGVPPVDRATLMAYNVGDLDDWATENSQLDSTITAAYLNRSANDPYPIRLDLALPYYHWGVIYRDGELVYLVNELAESQLSDTSRFKRIAEHRFRVEQNTYLDGYYLYQDDLIRLEGPDNNLLKTVASQLVQIPAFPDQRLLFYRIGSKAFEEVDLKTMKELSFLLRAE